MDFIFFECYNVARDMRYKCAKFQLAIFKNKLIMVEGTGLTYSNCNRIAMKSLSKLKYAWQ